MNFTNFFAPKPRFGLFIYFFTSLLFILVERRMERGTAAIRSQRVADMCKAETFTTRLLHRAKFLHLLLRFIYSIGNTDLQRRRQRKILYLLVLPHGHNSQSSADSKLGNSFGFPSWVQGPKDLGHSYCLPRP